MSGVDRGDDSSTGLLPVDEHRHLDASVEEWWFSCWSADGTLGLVTGWRITSTVGWFWAELTRRGRPLLHMTEWSVPLRSNPMIAKAPEMWAEFECISPFEQWTVGNEMYAVALDDADEAFGRLHGHVTPFAMDLEWYATEAATGGGFADTGDGDGERGYQQRGVVHGVIELAEGPLELVEVPARRWHRWGTRLGDAPVEGAVAHVGLRAPVQFPDGRTMDLVLTRDGWRRRLETTRAGYRPVVT